MAVQPDHITTWDDFTARKAARETGEDLRVGSTATPQAAGSQGVLALHSADAGDPCGRRAPRAHLAAERIREMTLLEVLRETMQRAQ
jgi:hypothetical protein